MSNYDWFKLVVDCVTLLIVPMLFFFWKLERRVYRIELMMKLQNGKIAP